MYFTENMMVTTSERGLYLSTGNFTFKRAKKTNTYFSKNILFLLFTLSSHYYRLNTLTTQEKHNVITIILLGMNSELLIS